MKTPFQYHKQSIRNELIRPFIISFLCTVALMASMLIIQSRTMVDNVLVELQTETLSMLDRELDTRLGEAVQLTHISYDAMKNSLLNIEDGQNREDFFSMMIKNYPNITMSYVGLSNGEFYGSRRNKDGSIDIGRNNASTFGHSEYYRINEQGKADSLIQVFENFDPRIRPWYTSAESTNEVVFSPVYSHFLFKEPTITASLSYYEKEELIGVFGVDLLLTWLGESLRKLPLGDNGLIFIVDQDGQLIATTTEDDLFEIVDTKSVNVSAYDIDNSVIQSILSMDKASNKDLKVNNKRYMVEEISYKYENIHWTIYIAMLKDDFLENMKITLIWTLILIVIITTFFIIGTVSIVKRVVAPIIKLTEVTKKYEKGTFEKLDLRNRKDEIYELNMSFNLMGQKIKRQVEILEDEVAARTKELEDNNQLLSNLSYTDQLLQIANRRKFDETVNFMYKIAVRNALPFTIMMIDIDDFKNLNDTYGHLEGDNCLVKIASAMQKCISRKTDLLARYGGEEFVVAMMDLRKDQALDRAECIRKSVEDLMIENIKTKVGFVTVSVGIAYMTPTQENTLEEFVDLADQAMYDAKVYGKNQCMLKEL